MKVSGYAIVAGTFVGVALLAHVVIGAVGWDHPDFALVVAAIVGTQVGTLVWLRQSPSSSERAVKLGLGTVLSVTAAAFALALQATTGWLTYPEVTVPIAAIGCFAFPFALVSQLWKSLSRGSRPDKTRE